MDLLIEYGADITHYINNHIMFITNVMALIYDKNYYSIPKALNFIIMHRLVERAQRLNKIKNIPMQAFNIKK